MSEQARRVTDWRREKTWETVELKDQLQLEMEGELHSKGASVSTAVLPMTVSPAADVMDDSAGSHL